MQGRQTTVAGGLAAFCGLHFIAGKGCPLRYFLLFLQPGMPCRGERRGLPERGRHGQNLQNAGNI